MLCVSCFTGGCGRFGWKSSDQRERQQDLAQPRSAGGEYLSTTAMYNLWRGGLTTSTPAINLPPVPQPRSDGASPSSRHNQGLSLDPEACSRRLFSSGVGLDHTPSGREAEAFPYYCPLCMNYYKGIFESNCCKHLVCYGCLLNFVAGKYGVTGEDLPYLEVPFLFPLPCPHCNSLTFEPQPASKHGVVRSYKDDHPLTSMSSLGSNSNNGHSPVRPGDSFEKLQRKMIRFDSNASSTGGGAEHPPTPADSVMTELTEEDMLDVTPVFGTTHTWPPTSTSVVSPPGTEMVRREAGAGAEEEEGEGQGEEEEGEAVQGGARAVRHLSGLAHSPSGTML